MIQPIDKSGERIRKMFADIAPRYDLMNHLLSLNVDRWWRSQTVKRLKLDRHQPVLDICTGTGDLALAIARRLRGSVEVIGTDFCEEMLQVAREKAKRGSPAEQAIRFERADSLRLPFVDDHFQAVTVAFGIRNVADLDAGLHEMRRVCTNEGQVAILEFSEPKIFGLRQAYAAYFYHILPRVGQTFSRNAASAYQYLPASVQQFPSGKHMAQRMTDVGLRNVQYFSFSFGIATLYLGEK